MTKLPNCICRFLVKESGRINGGRPDTCPLSQEEQKQQQQQRIRDLDFINSFVNIWYASQNPNKSTDEGDAIEPR